MGVDRVKQEVKWWPLIKHWVHQNHIACQWEIASLDLSQQHSSQMPATQLSSYDHSFMALLINNITDNSTTTKSYFLFHYAGDNNIIDRSMKNEYGRLVIYFLIHWWLYTNKISQEIKCLTKINHNFWKLST